MCKNGLACVEQGYAKQGGRPSPSMMRKWKWERADADGSKSDKDRGSSKTTRSKRSKKEVSTLTRADRAAPSGARPCLRQWRRTTAGPSNVCVFRRLKERKAVESFEEMDMAKFEGYRTIAREEYRNWSTQSFEKPKKHTNVQNSKAPPITILDGTDGPPIIQSINRSMQHRPLPAARHTDAEEVACIACLMLCQRKKTNVGRGRRASE